MDSTSKVAIEDIQQKKNQAQKITMLTAYDYPLALLVDQAGIDMVLVGDSLANVVLGLESTKDVGMPEMLHHVQAVTRAVKRALVIGDMPFVAYQQDADMAVVNAQALIDLGGCDAVKLEWFDQCVEVVAALRQAEIAVMGHVGLTPQTAEQLGGFKVQGKDAASAHQIMEQALMLEKAGCFSLVLECIPRQLARLITQAVNIPTIGIGAGVDCDGQVLVSHDLLGIFERYTPKFVKRYAHLNPLIQKAMEEFRDDVQAAQFPSLEYTYSMSEAELKRLGLT